PSPTVTTAVLFKMVQHSSSVSGVPSSKSGKSSCCVITLTRALQLASKRMNWCCVFTM
ncbi:Hypothetical predicted protein, partial [Podarcis lilfordi]